MLTLHTFIVCESELKELTRAAITVLIIVNEKHRKRITGHLIMDICDHSERTAHNIFKIDVNNMALWSSIAR